ncbi:MAG: thiamine phosphate synthase [Alphaproteobacteria bacterium]|nr:thiamine phosphate synthase [Alphaproteobacteria bacterium]
MRSVHGLAAIAARLNRDAGAGAIPSLYFFTDPMRTPDPVAVVRGLPRGTAVVYRHFGAEDRADVARQLAAQCRSRGLVLLIGADAELAQACRADGVHWPERLMPSARGAAFRIVTAAAHDAKAVARANAAGLDACVLSPVFPSTSASAQGEIGVFSASQIARSNAIPVIALGGVTARNATRLCGRGFAGVAAVDAFLEA